ncbi:hypothetical protein ACJJTC_007378 [Scirpophaga incertulas]
MSKVNALAGLIGSYGDSDDESDDGGHGKSKKTSVGINSSTKKPSNAADMKFSINANYPNPNAAMHPAPIAHCLWSACYDENSGFTYYWNQQTNAVTWEAPPEYLLALKLAQQQLQTIGSSEVSAEEWQLYQQALLEKQKAQNKVVAKPPVTKPPAAKPPVSHPPKKAPSNRMGSTKRRFSDDEDDVKIELITSYYNSDSDSNEESESPAKPSLPCATVKPPKIAKTEKKSKKTTQKALEYGPPLPPNQNYTVPIGPELPPGLVTGNVTVPTEQKATENNVMDIVTNSPELLQTKVSVSENEDSQDERMLLSKLKDKAKLLEKLGGEIPEELQEIIRSENISIPFSPKIIEESCKETQSTIDTNIDDLLEQIEKKELPKIKSKNKTDLLNDNSNESNSHNNSSKPLNINPTADSLVSSAAAPLFPSSVNMTEEPVISNPLFPSASNINESVCKVNATVCNVNDKNDTSAVSEKIEKKCTNMYLMDSDVPIENVTRKKLRISNSVLPVKKIEIPSYTTKYSQAFEGFSGERTGLGFCKENDDESPKNTISYGNGLTFTKGETLNEDKSDDTLKDLTDLLEAKLKYLNQLQPCSVTPMQEMVIQMQTLSEARAAGALQAAYWARSEGRYRYEREADGLVQWEYPADANMDMDICTTPPHPGVDAKEPKQEIGDELLSFYNDIAELEKKSENTAPSTSEPPAPAESIVKISSSIGLKHKSVSNLVAKWQQVAEEIDSD